ncbi:hypothetical protein IAQ61_011931 [Plenodomus lingam]|uniref:prephenate dehydratase n=1 Tax=Leptosphaeria maculans (strain JN3 / isolate v23.1.3 / race Av1-4-5-6-7-8) TaxID=985895 RepID=E5ABJ3_LEPMJ|nr:hypothetical protein LEMA_P021640.1 [Plenodomus lingam JN3]KAH9860147.1 hypothetical protein IAQ61_011931 [Plenodomus lingam]CBY01034.1 hypothetical protein LEMA_P021640.1 [Plenodomus lingam JN3]
MAGDESAAGADAGAVVVVAYLGPEGSYTHQAALSAFPPNTTATNTNNTNNNTTNNNNTNNNNAIRLSPQRTIPDIFNAVQSGTAARGVVPFENSSNGSVVFTLDLFADIEGKYPDIEVCDEAYVEVKHCLLGHAPQLRSVDALDTTTAPEPGEDGTLSRSSTSTTPPPHPDLTKIQTLYSHPQAWGQCTRFLTTHLPHTTRHDVSSTSAAAALVAQDPSGTSAALSSRIAADLFGLDVLASAGVNDSVGNTTRFLVIRRRMHGVLSFAPVYSPTGIQTPPQPQPRPPNPNPSPNPSPLPQRAPAPHPSRYKSLVTFTPNDSSAPGALAACLAPFSTRGINLTSISTRPAGVRNWSYVFFVEFEGGYGEEGEEVGGGGGGEGEARRQGGKDEQEGQNVKEALRELGSVCRRFRWLGSWVDRTPRDDGV